MSLHVGTVITVLTYNHTWKVRKLINYNINMLVSGSTKSIRPLALLKFLTLVLLKNSHFKTVQTKYLRTIRLVVSV